MIAVQDVNTGSRALIDKGEFVALPPCNPVTVPVESSRPKSKKKSNMDRRSVMIKKHVGLAERLSSITKKVTFCLKMYELLF